MKRSGEEKTFCERETEENSMEQKGVQKIKSAGTNRHQADAEENSEEAARKKELLRFIALCIYGLKFFLRSVSLQLKE